MIDIGIDITDVFRINDKVNRWTYRQLDKQKGRQIDRKIERQIDRQIDRQSDRETDRYIDRYIDRKKDSQIAMQINRQLYRYKYRQIDISIHKFIQRYIDRQEIFYQTLCFSLTEIKYTGLLLLMMKYTFSKIMIKIYLLNHFSHFSIQLCSSCYQIYRKFLPYSQ